MITSNKEIQQATDAFLKNPEWAAYYDIAPSYVFRKHLELQFAASAYCTMADKDEMDELAARMHNLETLYTLEDWNYEFIFSGHNPHRTKCIKKRNELDPKLPAYIGEGIFGVGKDITDTSELKGYLFSIRINKQLNEQTQKDYDDLVYSVMYQLGNDCEPCVTIYAGIVSEAFACKDIKKAMYYADLFKQHSVYDLERDIVLLNPVYDSMENPVDPFPDYEEEDQN